MRLAMVEDHPIVRSSTLRLLSEELGVEQVHEFGCGEEFLRWFRPGKLDLLLLDLTLPDRDGLGMLGQLRFADPGLPILVFSMHDSALYRHQAEALGASAFLSKREDPAALVQVAGELLDGKMRSSLHDAADSQVASGHGEHVESSAISAEHALDCLSGREREVFLLLARGHSVKRIAALYGLSQKTVFFHRGRVLRKLGLENTVQLVLWARERGFV